MRTLHSDALAVLSRWPAPSPGQQELAEQYVDHLRRHPDAMTRECFPDHLTLGALVLSADGRSVLLNLHRKAQRWFHFGGHAEADDLTLRDGAARETREESGIGNLVLTKEPVQLSAHTVEFCHPQGAVRHLDVRYAALAEPSTAHAASEESLAVRWWQLDDADLPALDPDMTELIDLARAALL